MSRDLLTRKSFNEHIHALVPILVATGSKHLSKMSVNAFQISIDAEELT